MRILRTHSSGRSGAKSRGAGDEAAFAVPGTMRLRELGLLLGIARHLGISVAGTVDLRRGGLRGDTRARGHAAPRPCSFTSPC